MTEAMPRKTRKEKVHAQQRKEEIHPSLVFSFPQSIHPKSPVHIETTSQFELIRKYIVKTVILGGIFILFEISLAFFSKKLGW